MKKIVVSSIVALLSLSCSLSAPNNSTQEASSSLSGRMPHRDFRWSQYAPTGHFSLNFSDLEKEYKSFSTKALSDAYVKRMFGKYLAPVNSVQLTRQLEFSRYLKSQSDSSYEISLKTMFSQTPALYDQMTDIGTISDKMTSESGTFGTFVNGLSPYPDVPLSLNATNIATTSFTATWNPVSGATYEVVVDSNAPVSSATNSYAFSGLTGTNHTFKVRAIKNSITGNYSPAYNVSLIPSTLPANVIAVNASATGLNNGTNWTNAYTSLQSALTAATSGKEIWVAAGTYKPTTSTTNRAATFQLKNGVKVYGGFAGNEELLSQRNFTNNVVILSGDINNDDSDIRPTNTTLLKTDNSYHVIKGITGATLDGVTVKFGYADYTPTNDNSGGGMYNQGDSPTVTNVIFSYNYASSDGGGMYNESSSSPIVTNAIFSNNYTRGHGGGMFNYTSGNQTITNVIFSNNYAGFGGGMSNFSATPTVKNVTFSNNTAIYKGGAIYNSASGSTLTNVTFNNNTSPEGGGLFNASTPSSIVTNATFSNNSATISGGAMTNYSGATPTITNTTFYNNTAPAGGGMYNDFYGLPTVKNSIFWLSPINNFTSDSVIKIGYSDVQDGFSGISGVGIVKDLSGTVITNVTGYTVAHNINADPLFINALDLDGVDNILRTSDDGLALQSGSPARNTGTTSAAPANKDIADVTRPKGIAFDMGAYEFVE